MCCRSLMLPILLVAGFSIGCSAPIDPQDLLAQANNSNIQRLSNLYEAYQSRHNLKGPKNEEDFKSFLKSWNPKKLANIGVDVNEIDSLFVSNRDGQPFKIRYGVKGELMGSTAPVVFEANGVDGKKMVGFLDMTHREVEAGEYDDLWNGKY